jgi:hypothetical protein
MVSAYLLLQTSSVQTWLSHKIAANLSEKLHTRVEVGGVDIEFVKTVVLEDIFIGDKHQDTILCAKKLKVDISYFGWNDKWIVIDNVSLINAKVKMIKNEGEEGMNYTFLIKALSGAPDTTRKSGPGFKIELNSLSLTNLEFIYDYKQNKDTSWGMNYQNIRATSVNGRFSDIHAHGDTLHATIQYLSAREKSGFILKSLSAEVELSKTGAEFKQLKILTPESNVNMYMLFSYKDPSDIEDFVNKVSMTAEFDHSTVEMGDITYFASGLKGMREELKLKGGSVKGKVTDLKGKDLDISFGEKSHFNGDVSFQGLPDISQTYIVFKAKEVLTDKQDLETIPIPPFTNAERLKLPANMAMLGDIHFHGTWEGFFSEFVAYGEFNTAIGSLASDISLKTNADKKISYEGKVKIENFDVGRFFSIPNMGRISMTGNLVGSDMSNRNSEISLKEGLAQSLDFNSYTYKNIRFDGNFSRQDLLGNLEIDDDNIHLNYKGHINFKGRKPQFDFMANIDHADLGALHFMNNEKKNVLSAHLDVNMSGDNMDNLLGKLKVTGLKYRQGKDSMAVQELMLVSGENADGRVITLNSDDVDATAKGRFTLNNISTYTRKVLATYVPAYFKDPKDLKPPPPEDLSFQVNLKNTDKLSVLFFPGLTAAHQTKLSGSINTLAKKLKLNGESKELGIYGKKIRDWKFSAEDVTDGRFLISMAGSHVVLSDSVSLDQFFIRSSAQKDSLLIGMGWKNNTAKKFSGELNAEVKVNSTHSLSMSLSDAQVYISDSLWSVNKQSRMRIDSSTITFRNFGFKNNQQEITLDGLVSGNKTDFLSILLNHFNLENLNPLLRNSNVSMKGHIDSRTSLSDVYHNMVFTSSSAFTALRVNGDTIGNGSVESVWDQKKDAIYLHGNFTRELLPNLLFSGYYYPSRLEDNLDFELTLNQLNLALVKPYVKDYCRNFEGHFAGNLTLKGSLAQPKLNGTITTTGDKITVNYLNTNYRFRDQIITVDENSFTMPEFTILDEFNNKAVIRNGYVSHDHFRNFRFNFPIETSSFMCLNTTDLDNPDYYGTAFLTGSDTIRGTLDDLDIEANVKTEKILDKKTNRTRYTNFFIPLENTQEVSQNNFIRFEQKDSTAGKVSYKVDLSGISLNFNLEVTPDANVQLIFDQKVGDVIKAKGTGNIQMAINSNGKFSMYGDYTIEGGEYLFTLKNLINKKFKIEKGGTISWSGMPSDATINLKADYQVRASLKPVVLTDTTGRRYPVNCVMLLTGSLLQPNINFDIDIPTVDETTREEVKRNINTDVEVNRQVLALLVLNNFVSPLGTEAQGAGTSTLNTSVNTTTSELLSSQLSNWLSQISNDFDLQVKYRPGDVLNRDEVEVALSTQALNDRLTVDGSVMSASATQKNTNNVVGDLNVEYKLTKNGKLRMKAYNKTNDNTVLNAEAPYSQGVGLAYKEEFNTMGELVRRYKEKIHKLLHRNNENAVVPVK